MKSPASQIFVDTTESVTSLTYFLASQLLKPTTTSCILSYSISASNKTWVSFLLLHFLWYKVHPANLLTGQAFQLTYLNFFTFRQRMQINCWGKQKYFIFLKGRRRKHNKNARCAEPCKLIGQTQFRHWEFNQVLIVWPKKQWIATDVILEARFSAASTSEDKQCPTGVSSLCG